MTFVVKAINLDEFNEAVEGEEIEGKISNYGKNKRYETFYVYVFLGREIGSKPPRKRFVNCIVEVYKTLENMRSGEDMIDSEPGLTVDLFY